MARVLVEASDAVSRCVRGAQLPSVCLRAHVCVLIYQSWQYFGSAGQKRIFESNSKPQALFQGI